MGRLFLSLILLLLPSTSFGQIARHQGLGPIESGPPSYATISSAKATFREWHQYVISVRVDAKVDRDKCPKEADRCIAACENLEAVIVQVRSELMDGGTQPETISAHRTAGQQFLFASRDFYRRLAEPDRPYRMPPNRIGYGFR